MTDNKALLDRLEQIITRMRKAVRVDVVNVGLWAAELEDALAGLPVPAEPPQCTWAHIVLGQCVFAHWHEGPHSYESRSPDGDGPELPETQHGAGRNKEPRHNALIAGGQEEEQRGQQTAGVQGRGGQPQTVNAGDGSCNSDPRHTNAHRLAVQGAGSEPADSQPLAAAVAPPPQEKIVTEPDRRFCKVCGYNQRFDYPTPDASQNCPNGHGLLTPYEPAVAPPQPHTEQQ